LLSAVLILAIGIFIGSTTSRTVVAQSVPPLQIQAAGLHTSCTVTPTSTTYCFAADGLWQSINGGAFTQLGGGVAGVTSVTVNGGTPQTGAVALTIPTQATTTSTTVLK
jgi:hypothetical protein